MALLSFAFWQNDTTRTDARFRFKPLPRWIYSSPLESTPIRALSAFYPVMCGDTRSIMLSSKCKLCLFPARSCLLFFFWTPGQRDETERVVGAVPFQASRLGGRAQRAALCQTIFSAPHQHCSGYCTLTNKQKNTADYIQSHHQPKGG